MKKVLAMGLAIFSTALLAGAYKLGADVPSAELAIDAQSDSTKTTMITLRAIAHENAECAPNAQGSTLGRDFTSGTTPVMKPVRIAADKAFAFTTTYMESRFGETRQCSMTASFTPLASHRYLARVITTDQAGKCELGVFDITDGTAQFVDFHMPQFVCGNKKVTNQPNGKPGVTNFRIYVIPTFN